MFISFLGLQAASVLSLDDVALESELHHLDDSLKDLKGKKYIIYVQNFENDHNLFLLQKLDY